MDRLARERNVSVKLSGFGLGHPRWTLEDTVPLLRQVIGIFGADRVMVGSNLPVDRLFASGRRIVEAIREAVLGLDPDDANRVLERTAERVYRI